MNTKTERSTFIRCCYSYVVSGMSILVIGAILPSIMEEAHINFTVAGGLLSMLAIGNLLASFVFPAVAKVLGQRASITLMTALVPVSFLILTLLPPMYIVYILMLLTGLTKGSITIVNNVTVNRISHNSGKVLNLLHCTYAAGAFLAPFLSAIFVLMGFGWRTVIYLMAFFGATSSISYFQMDYEDEKQTSGPVKKAGETHPFLKSPDYYFIGLLLFFYLGLENCINGWFVTYLQSTGRMTETYATIMVSVTWLCIMLGRLTCASLAKKYSNSMLILINTLGSAACFFLLIFSTSLAVITLSLAGLGFFLAGIYPTCMALSGNFILGSTSGMALLTAISAVGGIITPQLVGAIADRIGMVSAISFTAVNLALMLLFSFMIKRRNS